MAIIRRNKRGRVVYAVRYDYHRGKARERQFATLTEAKAFDANLRLRRSATQLGPGTLTIEQLASVWESEHTARLAPSTRRGYNRHLRLRILPSLGTIPIGELDTVTIATWIRDLDHVGLSKHQQSGAMRTLRSMTRWAIIHGYAHTDPTIGIRITGMPRPAKAVALTRSQVDQLADAFPLLRDATLIRVGAGTGMRPSELFALQWDDVNIAARRVTVRRARAENGTVKDLKNHRERIVPLMSSVVTALTVWQTHAPPVPWIFPNEQGGMIGGSRWHKKFRQIRKTAGFPNVSLNNLRDTFASTMIEAGASPRQLQAWLGHSSIHTTYAHYAAELEGRDSAVIAAADNL